jgi:hypothetical protein
VEKSLNAWFKWLNNKSVAGTKNNHPFNMIG